MIELNKINEIKKLIANKVNYPENQKYCAIIGLNPSKGARSPLLWNAAFVANKLKVEMIPFDIEKKNLKKLFQILNDDSFFLGGAIAAPHKELIFKYLGSNVSRETIPIKAVNCLYRNKDGALNGTNTDGEASIFSFKKKFKNIRNLEILIFGLGGVGKAVTSFFSKEINNIKNLHVFSTNKKNHKFVKLLGSNLYNYDKIKNFYNTADVIINCTDLGSKEKLNETILNIQHLKKFKKKLIVFDVIYNPKETKLIRNAKKLNYKYLNGLEMNLYQAILAFNYSIDEKIRSKNTSDIMKKIK